MKKLRILALMHADLVPPDDVAELDAKRLAEIQSEYDVVKTLRGLGHEVRKVGLYDELLPLRTAIHEWRPHITFNLLEEFRGLAVYDQNVVSYLELMHVPYTGNNPRGMVIARDKALTKKILQHHRIRTPRFTTFALGRRARLPKHLSYPVIVKSQLEEASYGISQASVVSDEDALRERVRFIHDKVRTSAIVEQFTEGRELYVGVLGNRRLQVLPVWELYLEKLPEDAHRIATRAVKWDLSYQERHEIDLGPAEALPAAVVAEIESMAKRAYRVLEMSGYARIDFRLCPRGVPYLIEANPNPDISRDGELASAALAADISFGQLLQRMVNLGLRRDTGP